MVEIFIDEGGQFTRTSGWGVVCGLALPDTEVGRLRRKLSFLTRDWPKAPSGELKGGSLSTNHLTILVDHLFPRDALLFATAIDMSKEGDEELRAYKKEQCERITRHLTPEHHEKVIAEVWALRRTLEAMPVQLYVQSVLMNELTASAVEMTAMYFSQRRPKNIGKFKWIIDAKDPQRVTTQEKWWRDTLGPFQESRSLRQPIATVDDPEFDYRFFEKSYGITKEIWHPDKPREVVQGFDIKKIISDSASFIDSRSDILLQSVDILTNFLRKLLMGRISDPAVTRALGRLQIHRRQEHIDQSIALIALTQSHPTGYEQLAGPLSTMSRAGRSMIRKRMTVR